MSTTPKTLTLAERFAQNIHNHRSASNLTQQVLAKKLGVSTSYLSMLERGSRTPPLNMVDQIARKLKIDPLQLLQA